MRVILLTLFALLFLGLIAYQAQAADIIAKSLLRRGTILTVSDIQIKSNAGEDEDSIRQIFLGQQLHRTIYQGHKIYNSDLGAPILVKRNADVQMRYRYGPLLITTKGRALNSGGKGEYITVINTNSRKKVEARIVNENIVEIGK